VYDTTVLTEMDGSFQNGDLHTIVNFVDVGKAVLNPAKALKYNARLRKALKEIKPDVCLTFTIRPAIYGNIVTRSLQIPTISTITGTGPCLTVKAFHIQLPANFTKRC
jgi:UDP-N-acetylglucosamine:LPS N-acetylglucosamine transferase